MSVRTPILTGPSWAAAPPPSSAKTATTGAASLAFMIVLPGSLCSRVLSRHLDAVVFDHGIGKEFLRRVLERRFGAGAVGALDLDVKNLALAHAGDAADAERTQRAFDGLALRVEDAGFQRDGDAGFHGQVFMGKFSWAKRSSVACRYGGAAMAATMRTPR